MLTEKLQEDLAALADEASIAAAENILKQRRTTLMKGQIEALPKYVTVTRVDGGGIPIEVTREVAAGLLRRGTHKVA